MAAQPHSEGIAGHLHYWTYVVEKGHPFMQIHLDTMTVTILIAAAMTIFSFWLKARLVDGTPSGTQNFIESVIDFINQTVRDNFPVHNPLIAPLAMTVFVFILLCNTMDILPAYLMLHIAHLFGIEHFRPVPTNDLNLPAAMAVTGPSPGRCWGYSPLPSRRVRALLPRPKPGRSGHPSPPRS